MRQKLSSFSRLRSLSQSKKGIVGIFFGVWAVYVVIHDFLDFLRDVSYTAKHVGPVLGVLIGVLNFLIAALNFLTTGVGNLVAIALAVIFIWWALRTQPEQLNSGNVATAQTNAAKDAEQVKTELDEAKQEIERLRTELNNRPRHYDTPIVTTDMITSNEARKIEEDKQKLRDEIEELKGENERLQTEATSPEVSKQKRLCFHLADDLRRLYREFQDGERMLIAHLQEQEEANIPEGEHEEERHTQQLDLENKTRHKYHLGFPDRLEKLYEELEPGGWLGPNDETLFMNLTDPNDIKKVADRLEEVGRNLL